MTSERLQALKRAVAFAGFGALVFVATLTLGFPYERARDRILAVLAAQGVHVEVAEVGPTLGIGMSMKEILVQTRPQPPAKSTRFAVDWARIRLWPLPRFLGGPTLEVSGEAFDGRIDFSRRITAGEAIVGLDVGGVDIGKLPGVKEAVNLPLAGKLELGVDLVLPMGRYSEAQGEIHWRCADCVLGDGKEKLRVAGNPLLAEGISLPRVRLGNFEGRITVSKGVGKLVGVRAKSPDGEVSIEGEITFRDPLPFSVVRLYLQFKLSEALVKSNDKIQLLMQLAQGSGKRPDGFYGVILAGRIASLDPPLWSKSSPFAAAGVPGASGRPGRPGAIQARPAAPPAAGGGRPAQVTVAPEPPPLAGPPPPPPLEPAPALQVEEDESAIRATPPPATPPSPGGPTVEALKHVIPVPPAPTPAPSPGEVVKQLPEEPEE